MNSRNKRGMDAFEREFRRWGERPPLTPPEEARRRITARLEPARSGLPVWHMATAAVAVVLLVSGTWAGLKITSGSLPHTRPDERSAVTTEFTPPPLDENVVLWWLDDETPVYFVLGSGGPS
jgi:hypothetical protein